MKEISWEQHLREANQALAKGAFLTVKSGDEINTMTIGWGSIGYTWAKPIFMVMVRDSRYTYQLIEDNTEFTVSIPLKGQLKEELKFCGTKSGREYDKISECNLELIEGKDVTTPLIKGCNLHYECKIKFKQRMKAEDLTEDYQQKWYQDEGYHTLYFGEIVGCYLAEE